MQPIPLWRTPQQPETPTLVPYLVPGGEVRPAIVVCPGGGYAYRADHEGAPVAEWLNSLGLHAFVCQYRVAPARHPVPLQDAQRALRLVRHHAAAWRVDAGRVGILGCSAGGHLAASAVCLGDAGDPSSPDPVARHRGRPDALIACYPVISSGPHAHRGSFDNLVGQDPEARRALSLELAVPRDHPPAFLWSTSEDAKVPVANSLLYAVALCQQGVPFALHVYPHGSHGMSLATGDPVVSDWTARCAVWLQGLGWR